MNWVLATQNQHKVTEINHFFNQHDVAIEFLSLKDIGFNNEIAEIGNTFEQNALIKAQAIQKVTHLPVLADDSGLEVIALNNAPGVFSARYAGNSCLLI